MEPIEEVAARHAGKPHMLLGALQEIQERAGYIPRDAAAPLARALGVPEGEVHAVVSFYTELRTTPPGKHRISVCRGDSCAAVGARDVAERVEAHLGVGPGGTTSGGEVSYDTVFCLGNCALSPSIAVDGEVYGRVTPDRALGHLEAAKEAARA